MSRVSRRRRVLPAVLIAWLLVLSLSSLASATTQPSPAEAPYDYELLWKNGCFAFEAQVKPKSGCVFGDPNSTYKVVMVGDSHTSDFFPAFNRIAKARHWRLYPYVKANCPFIDLDIRNSVTGRRYRECAAWNQNVLGRLKALQPDLTITIPFRWIQPIDTSKSSPAATGEAIGRMLHQLTGKKLVIVDSPYSNRDVPSCVKAQGATACAIPRDQVLSGGVKVREQRAAEVADGLYLNLTPQICGGFPCRVVTNGILEFRDRHHLTATFTASFTPIMDAALKRVLGLS